MRWIRWASVLMAGALLVSPAPAFEPGCESGMPCAGCGQYPQYSGPACAVTCFALVPGCCECPPSCCDGAWAGYCQEKARRRAFWARLGTWAACRAEPMPVACACQPTAYPVAPMPPPVEPADPVKPSDALPPPPKPTPEKTTWQWKIPWFR